MTQFPNAGMNCLQRLLLAKVYLNLIENCGKELPLEEKIYQVFSSFISDAISDFNSNIYYSNPGYLLCSYEEGKLLA